MVLKRNNLLISKSKCFRSMSYWMVLKHATFDGNFVVSFRSMSYWMVLKQLEITS